MAIVFHSDKYSDIKTSSHTIIGVTGYKYQEFIRNISGDIFFIDNKIDFKEKMVTNIINIKNIKEESLDNYLRELGLDKSFLSKSINSLSHSEKKLLKYLHMLTFNPNIIVIDEPFLDLDYHNKKRITALFNKLVKKKTIIIGSFNSDIIYSLCKKVLLVGKDKVLYGDVLVLSNKNILKQYRVNMPQIIEFIRLANDKKAKLPYSKDIRDLIKDVYKHVSK